MKSTLVGVMMLVAAVLGFLGGIQYQKSTVPTFGNRNQMYAQGNGQAQRQMGGGMQRIIGEIVSVDDTSITVKLPDNSSKIVLIADTTGFSKSSKGSKADLKVGVKIGVFGTVDTEGTVTAQDVQINPSLVLSR